MNGLGRIGNGVLLVLVTWLAVAVGAGLSGWTLRLRPPQPQLILSGLVAVLLVCFIFSKPFRTWLLTIPISWLIGLHFSRIVGAGFMVLESHGQLPWEFAVPGGWGDIFVAGFAAPLLLADRLGPPMPRMPYVVWNAVGLLDILFVAGTATRLALRNPASMMVLLQFPWCLLPTFLVPLIIFTHCVIGFRLIRTHGSEL